MANNPRPVANIPAVSRALGAYRDKDDNRLLKAGVVNTPDGPEDFGGYRVVYGLQTSLVSVQWIAPDAMDRKDIEENRAKFLALYTEILQSRGFTVEQYSYGLSVSRVYED